MKMSTWIVGALIAATVPLAEALTTFDPEAILDWRKWAVGLAAGSVRQVAVYLLAQLAASRAR